VAAPKPRSNQRKRKNFFFPCPGLSKRRQSAGLSVSATKPRSTETAMVTANCL
jgi:hypothetical protein